MLNIADALSPGQLRIKVSDVPEWRGFAVEWHEGERFVLSRRDALFVAEGVGGRPSFVARVPRSTFERSLSYPRLLQRLTRSMFYNVLPLPAGGWFTSFAKRLGMLVGEEWTEIRLRRPTRVLRGGFATSPDGAIWFGEYWNNADRDEVHLYRWQPGDAAAEVVHTFPRGTTYHVHGVTWDPYRNALVCLTGDRGRECRILLSTDGFRTIDVIGEGSEDWRAVSIVVMPDGWLYATDAEFQQNVVASVDATTGARRVLGRADGPTYYSRRWGGHALFAVTAERCAIMPRPKASLLSVQDTEVNTVLQYDKDLSSSRLAWRVFLPGTLHFAAGVGADDTCLVSGVALRGMDGRVVALRRAAAESMGGA